MGESTMAVVPLMVPEHHALKLKTFSVVHPASSLVEPSVPASPPASPLEVPLDDPDEDPLEVPLDVPLDDVPLELEVVALPSWPASGVELEELLLHPPVVNKTPRAVTPRAAAQIVAR
jgi:hypothetical protein